jgi:class 3 adenylate cyclase
VGLAFLIARSIVRPVRQLTDIADRLEKGDYRVPELAHAPTDGDELAVLTRAFASMARGLELREKERDVFGRVVSPEVREKLLEGTLGLGGETLHVAVLFSDIRGFSTLTERTPAHELVSLLNEYLTAMTEAVRPFKGYVNNFIGDAIVVVFGAPVASSDVEVRAARAALAMREALAALNERRTKRGEQPIANGIGLAAGPVVAGQIGSLERMLYTVIGDCVNVAARLESMTKEYPEHPILATRAIADASQNAGDLKLISIGAHTVKGRVASVEVFGLHS